MRKRMGAGRKAHSNLCVEAHELFRENQKLQPDMDHVREHIDKHMGRMSQVISVSTALNPGSKHGLPNACTTLSQAVAAGRHIKQMVKNAPTLKPMVSMYGVKS